MDWETTHTLGPLAGEVAQHLQSQAIESAIRIKNDRMRTVGRTRLELEDIQGGETRGWFDTVLRRVEVGRHCRLAKSSFFFAMAEKKTGTRTMACACMRNEWMVDVEQTGAD